MSASSQALIVITMENTNEHELASRNNDITNENTVQDMNFSLNDYENVKRLNNCISRSRMKCALKVTLTFIAVTAVIAVIAAVIILFTAQKMDGAWSSWNDWGSCSVSCGYGMKTRNRTCTNPVPQGPGGHCHGHSLENTLCFPGSCTNGSWTDWQNWSNCSVDCGVGFRTRSRTCSNPDPSQFGTNCQGKSFDIASCSKKYCDACQSQPCHYGNCRSNAYGFECLCFPGFSGLYCQNDFDDCDTKPCFKGYCNNLADGYRCSCFAGFSGTRCQYMDQCRSNRCANGTCIDEIGDNKCSCKKAFDGTHCQRLITDCVDVLRYTGSSMDGVYTVRTWKRHEVIKVYCDMTTDGGGWTVFQNRFDGSVDFYRNFSEYDKGFGNLTTEFWLGLSNIQEIAGQSQTDLRIDLEAANGTKAYERFEHFSLSPGPAYKLHLGRTIAYLRISSHSNRFGVINNGTDFSTYDHDGNVYGGTCPVPLHGAWWYRYCATSNLNGRYFTPGTFNKSSMSYNSFVFQKSLKTSKMMMRRK